MTPFKDGESCDKDSFLKSCFSISTPLYNISTKTQQWGKISKEIFPLTVSQFKSIF